MNESGLDIDQVGEVKAYMEALACSEFVGGARRKNGGGSVLRLTGMDEKNLCLSCNINTVGENENGYTYEETIYVCNVLVSLVLDKDICMADKVSLARGWQEVKHEESESIETKNEDGSTTTVTTKTEHRQNRYLVRREDFQGSSV